MLKKPKCANWSLWEGNEVEGNTDKGVKTLFIRKIVDKKEILSWLNAYDRIWFCEEFQDQDFIKQAIKIHNNINISLYVNDIDKYTKWNLKNSRVYLKIPIVLKPKDYICIGKPFEDESFEIGSGFKVKPKDYINDKNKGIK